MIHYQNNGRMETLLIFFEYLVYQWLASSICQSTTKLIILMRNPTSGRGTSFDHYHTTITS